MSFGNGFGIGFLIFVVLILVFSLLISVLIGGNIAAMFADLNSIIITLLGGALIPPTLAIFLVALVIGVGGNATFSSTIGIAMFLQMLAFIIIPLISAIITGKLAGGKVAAFFAWFLISILSAAIIAIMIYLDILSYVGLDTMMLGLGGGEIIVMMILTFGVINGIFYGAFAELVSSDDLY